MQKYKIFFEQIKLLPQNEFDSLFSSATIKCELPQNRTGTIKIFIDFAELPNIDIYGNFIKNYEKINHNHLEVIFTKKKFDISGENLTKILNIFTDGLKSDASDIRKIIKYASLKINDDCLEIGYINEDDKNKLQNIEKKLLKFFSESFIDISKINLYESEELKKLIDDHRAKADAESKKLDLPTEEDEKLKKIINLNRIPKDITPIKFTNAIESPTGENFAAAGQIFKTEVTVNKIKIFKFWITDFEDAVLIKTKVFDETTEQSGQWKREPNLPEWYLSSFKNGDWVKIYGKFSEDKYERGETTCWANKILKVDKPQKFVRSDKSKKPRIELFSRTQMSSFEGMISPIDACKRAKEYGAPAIAFADRHNVQSFPDIASASKNTGVKAIYGFEADVQYDEIHCVKNAVDANLSTTSYVIFDLETTGLCAEYDEILEFGGIKVENGTIVERKDFFIKPTKPIPAKISKLTHITDEMVHSGCTILEALKDIKEWIKDYVLVAHNGINFDIRFLNKKLEQNGMEPITNPLIDTMVISRSINPAQTRHNLGVLSRNLKLKYDETTAHRADFDAEVLYTVWKNMIKQMEEIGVTNLQDINSKLQSPALHRRQFASYMNIYAKNQQGIKDIYKLISSSHTINLYEKPRVFRSLIEKNRDNLFICNSPSNGELWDTAINGTRKELEDIIVFYDYVFIAPPSVFAHEHNRGNLSLENTKKTIQTIVDVAKKFNKKVIAVSSCSYLDPTDALAHSVLVSAKQVGGGRHPLFSYNDSNDVMPALYMRTTQEMLDEMNFLSPDDIEDIVINNTYDFSDRIEKCAPLKSRLYAPTIENSKELLSDEVEKNKQNIYGDNILPEFSERIKNELNIINGKGFDVIYWISNRLVRKSISDGYLVGSRGSVGSSVIAFLGGISEVNPFAPHYICKKCKYTEVVNDADCGYDLPLKKCPVCGEMLYGDGHDLPFETFLGTEGAEKVPDIDLNFSGEYQNKAHDFIREMFDAQHAFRAGTIMTIAEKTAIGYVKNYFEMTTPDVKVRESLVTYLASQCVGVKKTTGKHAGGIIVIPKENEIEDFTPINYPPDENETDWLTTHFDFNSMHDTVLKFDILGHDNPTILKMLKDITKIDPVTVPNQDPEVIAIFSSTSTLNLKTPLLNEKVGTFGIPEFGTGFVRGMLVDANPQSFADLVRISGLSHGTDVWRGNADELIKNGTITLKDSIACRESISSYLRRKNVPNAIAFKVTEDVRKGKGVKPDYAKTMLENNVPQWFIDSCNKIKYLFPKAHATAYVLDAWRIAWYKIHQPLAFYSTFLSVRIQVFDIDTILAGPQMIKEKLDDITKRLRDKTLKVTVKNKEESMIEIYQICYEMYSRGFKFKNISLYKSDSKHYIIDGDSLIPPFSCIDGLGEAAAESVITARKERPFTSIEDLSRRTKLSKTHIAKLESLGVLSDLDKDDQMTFF